MKGAESEALTTLSFAAALRGPAAARLADAVEVAPLGRARPFVTGEGTAPRLTEIPWPVTGDPAPAEPVTNAPAGGPPARTAEARVTPPAIDAGPGPEGTPSPRRPTAGSSPSSTGVPPLRFSIPAIPALGSGPAAAAGGPTPGRASTSGPSPRGGPSATGPAPRPAAAEAPPPDGPHGASAGTPELRSRSRSRGEPDRAGHAAHGRETDPPVGLPFRDTGPPGPLDRASIADPATTSRAATVGAPRTSPRSPLPPVPGRSGSDQAERAPTTLSFAPGAWQGAFAAAETVARTVVESREHDGGDGGSPSVSDRSPHTPSIARVRHDRAERIAHPPGSAAEPLTRDTLAGEIVRDDLVRALADRMRALERHDRFRLGRLR